MPRDDEAEEIADQIREITEPRAAALRQAASEMRLMRLTYRYSDHGQLLVAVAGWLESVAYRDLDEDRIVDAADLNRAIDVASAWREAHPLPETKEGT